MFVKNKREKTESKCSCFLYPVGDCNKTNIAPTSDHLDFSFTQYRNTCLTELLSTNTGVQVQT